MIWQKTEVIDWPTADRLISENTVEITSDGICAEPTASVCLVAYNHRQFISQAIESVLMQETGFRFEILLGDDHSADGTTEMLLQYQRTYPERIRLFLSESRLGEYTGNGRLNLSRLLKASRGKYIALLDGDDYWTDPKKLEKQVNMLERHKEYSVCFHKVRILEKDYLREDDLTKIPSSTSTILDLAKGNYIHTCSCVFVNKVPDILGPGFLISPLGDYYLHVMNARFGQIFAIDQEMAVYRVHPASIWSGKSNTFRIQKTLESICAILGDLPKQYEEARSGLIDYCIDLAIRNVNNPSCMSVLDRIIRLDGDVYVKRFFKRLFAARSDRKVLLKLALRHHGSAGYIARTIFGKLKSNLAL